jgi:lipopolysaccharide transport system permease protein
MDRNAQDSIREPMPALLRTLFALIRRDYAVQYAGMTLGLFWLFINYGMQIGVFYLVIGKELYAGEKEYVIRLLSGMTLWIPLAEMLIRSGSILSENRVLIRRTNTGRELFIWIPVVQAMFHYLLLAIPISLILSCSRSGLSPLSALFSLITGLLAGWIALLIVSPWALILAKLAVILRDLTPLLRPVLQILFWLTPIAYLPAQWSQWNPLTYLMALHASFFAGSPLPASGSLAALTGLFITVAASLTGSIRLSPIVEDHL